MSRGSSTGHRHSPRGSCSSLGNKRIEPLTHGNGNACHVLRDNKITVIISCGRGRESHEVGAELRRRDGYTPDRRSWIAWGIGCEGPVGGSGAEIDAD